MRRWQWFSLGIVLGVVLAVGLGFAEAQKGGLGTSGPAQTASAEPAAPPAVAAKKPSDGKLRIIVFGAHPDDAEIRAGGAGALWAAQGHHVQLCSVTDGDIGHSEMCGAALAARRLLEAQSTSKILGTTPRILDIHDGQLEPTLENRRKITRAIREWNADIVIGHRPNDYHPDHRYVGVLMQDSAYMVTVPFFCPETPYLTGNPVFLYSQDNFQRPNPFRPDVVVAIDEVIDAKVKALMTMESQFVEGGANGPVPKTEAERKKAFERGANNFRRRFEETADRYRDKLIELYGPEQGKKVRYAEAFEVCEYGRRPNAQELRRLFPFFPKP